MPFAHFGKKVFVFLSIVLSAFVLSSCTSYSENTLFNQPTPVKMVCDGADTQCLSSLSDSSRISIQLKGKSPYFYDVNVYKERVGTADGSNYAFCMDTGEEFLVFNGDCYISNFSRSEIYYYFKNGSVLMASNDSTTGNSYDGQKALSCKDGRFIFPIALGPLLPPKSAAWSAVTGIQAYTNVPYTLEVKMKVWDLNGVELPQSLNMTHKMDILGNILFTNLTCFDADATAGTCLRVCPNPSN